MAATMFRHLRIVTLAAGGLVLGGPATGCSIRKIAINNVSDAIAASGSTYASDNDPQLIKDALPFGLKLMESLIAENPKHTGLIAATAGGFTQYAFAFVQEDAEEIEDTDLDASLEMRTRARLLYLRARNYGVQGLDVAHQGFSEALRGNPRSAVSAAKLRDVPLLYWTAVSWAAAISVSKDDSQLIGDLPIVEALIDRALALDESYDYGAIHTFLITYEMIRPGGKGDAVERARKQYERAMELTGGQLAAPLVAYAESIAVYEQDKASFESHLKRALAIDPNARLEWRLSNLIYQHRARWLLGRVDRIILG
jgi:predicted anti-sigma-YlaC factor YlaD